MNPNPKSRGVKAETQSIVAFDNSENFSKVSLHQDHGDSKENAGPMVDKENRDAPKDPQKPFVKSKLLDEAKNIPKT